jgi:hypothetical protein
LTSKQITRKNTYCSSRCAKKVQFNEKISKEIVIAPGDRWEPIAPQMTYTEAVRTADIINLMAQEVGRRYG